MSIEGWYYLHTNNDLIFKHDHDGIVADIRESTFAKGLWPVDPSDREGAWNILVESLAAGANKERVQSLAAKWNCNNKDAKIYADRLGVILQMDGDMWMSTRSDFIDLHESKAGFGKTILESLADLAKNLGYQPSTMWGVSFKQLVQK